MYCVRHTIRSRCQHWRKEETEEEKIAFPEQRALSLSTSADYVLCVRLRACVRVCVYMPKTKSKQRL